MVHGTFFPLNVYHFKQVSNISTKNILTNGICSHSFKPPLKAHPGRGVRTSCPWSVLNQVPIICLSSVLESREKEETRLILGLRKCTAWVGRTSNTKQDPTREQAPNNGSSLHRANQAGICHCPPPYTPSPQQAVIYTNCGSLILPLVCIPVQTSTSHLRMPPNCSPSSFLLCGEGNRGGGGELSLKAKLLKPPAMTSHFHRIKSKRPAFPTRSCTVWLQLTFPAPFPPLPVYPSPHLPPGEAPGRCSSAPAGLSPAPASVLPRSTRHMLLAAPLRQPRTAVISAGPALFFLVTTPLSSINNLSPILTPHS